jgi:peptidoglycan/LPS O-acetylase OafA/YrhL
LPTPRRRLGWLVYAAALTLAVLVGEVGRGTRPGPVALASWILTAALLVALWCYALRRRLGHEAYWRAAFWIVSFATLLMLVPVLMAGGELARYTLALTVPIVPAFVAAYLYAYRSPEIWADEA